MKNRLPKLIALSIILFLLVKSNIGLGQNDLSSISTNDTTYIGSIITKANQYFKDQPDSAKILLKHALELSKASGYKRGAEASLYRLGAIYSVEGSYNVSSDYFLAAIPFLDTLNSPDMLAKIYNHVGNNFARQVFVEKALEYYLQAAKYAQASPADLTRIYGNIGTLFSSYLNQQDKAITYFDKALTLTIQAGDTSSWCGALLNKALSYKQLGNITLSESLLDSALNLSLRHKLYREFVTATGNIINIYLENNDLIKAKKALKKAEEVSNSSVLHIREITMLYIYSGSVHLKSKEYHKAKQDFKHALNTLPKEEVMLYYNIQDQLRTLYLATGDYKKAYELKEIMTSFYDSLGNKEVVMKTQELETKYQSAEKDKQILKHQVQLLATEKQVGRKNFWIFTLTGSMLLMGFIFISIYQRQKIKLQRAQSKDQQYAIQQLNAALSGEEKERTRIGRQLHDDVMVEFSLVKMNLTTLSDIYPAIKNSSAYDTVSHQLAKTGVKIRQTAHNLMPDALMSEGLVFAISYFCNGITKTTDIDVKFEHFGTAPDITTDIELNLYRIIQELIQNVLKHAHATQILVQLFFRPTEISINVEDNGVGIKNIKKASEGLGIKSIQTRLKVMNGTIDIQPGYPNGTLVHVSVQLKEEQD